MFRNLGKLIVFLLLAAVGGWLLLRLFIDFRTPQQQYRDCFRTEMPTGATEISTRHIASGVLLIQFKLPPAKLAEFTARTIPGFEPWRRKRSTEMLPHYVGKVAREDDIWCADHLQKDEEVWRLIVNIPPGQVFAEYIDTGR